MSRFEVITIMLMALDLILQIIALFINNNKN